MEFLIKLMWEIAHKAFNFFFLILLATRVSQSDRDFTFSAMRFYAKCPLFDSQFDCEFDFSYAILWLIVLNHRLMIFEKHMHAQFLNAYRAMTHFTYHFYEVTGTLRHTYGHDLVLQIEPNGWKGSVTYGLGTEVSLPQCPITGIWKMVPKAITGPKSRGTSVRRSGATTSRGAALIFLSLCK